MGWFGPAAMILGPLIGGWLDERSAERLSARGEALAREAGGKLRGGMPAPRTRADVSRDLGLPGVSTGGFRYQPAGAASTIDLDKWFNVADVFKGAYGAGPDWDAILGDVKQQTYEGQVSPTIHADLIGKYFTEAETDKWLASTLEETAAASGAREATTRQDLLGSALARGKTLQEAGDMSLALSHAENVTRARQGLGAESAAEQVRNATRLARAGAQATGRTAAANINAQLAGLRAELVQRVGTQKADQYFRAAQQLAGFADVGGREKWGAMLDMINTQLAAGGMAEGDLNRQLQALMTEGGWLTGVPLPFVQPSTYINQATQNWMNWQAMNQSPKTGGGGSLSIAGFGGGYSQSCIDAESIIRTHEGFKRLSDIAPTDEILGADGKFHRVVAKDCGVDSDRPECIRITAGESQITATPEHVIDGRRADEWSVGASIAVYGPPHKRVKSVERTEYVTSGDLMLEDNVPYVANGFVVESMLGRMGVEKWRQHIVTLNGGQGGDRGGFIHDVNNPTGGFAMKEVA